MQEVALPSSFWFLKATFFCQFQNPCYSLYWPDSTCLFYPFSLFVSCICKWNEGLHVSELGIVSFWDPSSEQHCFWEGGKGSCRRLQVHTIIQGDQRQPHRCSDCLWLFAPSLQMRRDRAMKRKARLEARGVEEWRIVGCCNSNIHLRRSANESSRRERVAFVLVTLESEVQILFT